MLLGKDCRGHQVNHLLSLLDGLKSGSEGDFSLSVAHVAADQTVHNLFALHIPLCRFNGLQLVLRLFKGKHLLKLALPYRIRPILIAFALLSGGVQLHQLFGYLFDGPSYLCLCLIPLCAAQFIELRLFCIGSGIFLDSFEPRRGKIEVPSVPVLDFNIILDDFILFNFFDSAVNPKSMAFMNHIVSYGQFRKALNLLPLIGCLFSLLFLAHTAEHVSFGNHDKLDQRIFKPPVKIPVGNHDLSRQHLDLPFVRAEGPQIILP